MSAADLKAEGPGPDAVSENPPAQPKPEPVPHSPEIAQLLSMGVAVIGTGLCDRFAVTPVNQSECDMVGTAGAGVLAQYDVNANPKALAWLTLMGAVVGVVGPRFQEVRARRNEPPAQPEPPEEPASAADLDAEHAAAVKAAGPSPRARRAKGKARAA